MEQRISGVETASCCSGMRKNGAAPPSHSGAEAANVSRSWGLWERERLSPPGAGITASGRSEGACSWRGFQTRGSSEHTLTHSYTHTQSHTVTHSHTHSHTQPHTVTHSHTHTHTVSHSRRESGPLGTREAPCLVHQCELGLFIRLSLCLPTPHLRPMLLNQCSK